MNENNKYFLDPETIDGDYAEAYQRWSHHFNKGAEHVKECFKETAFVPFEPFFDSGIQRPNWKALAESMRKSQEEFNNER